MHVQPCKACSLCTGVNVSWQQFMLLQTEDKLPAAHMGRSLCALHDQAVKHGVMA